MHDTMKETLSKMSELKFEAPLAQFEEAEEWQSGFKNINENDNHIRGENFNKIVENGHREETHTFPSNENYMNIVGEETMTSETADVNSIAISDSVNNNVLVDNFEETVSGSLEDLVNTFDEKITRCFYNYQESVEKLAPVQVRSQEEIMNECQMWWTITGNFGNILPIDWSKSYSRKVHMPALNLKQPRDENVEKNVLDDHENEKGTNHCDLSSEDEAIANDLDMHSLILSGLSMDNEPVKTAEEVIREIDDIMEEGTSSECTPDSDMSIDEVHKKGKEVLQSPLYTEKLKTLSVSQLNELYLELELLIKDYSETLILELALRDELEFEKELKNSFISLLLGVQNRRRQYHVEKKKGIRNGIKANVAEPKYLTTVIPYHAESGPLDNQALQVLIKILKAINEDSPTVPTLLTDYILKVLCPT
ncbi:fasciculation and elongation protein zeta-2-like isoform X1 [Planococcus citri]|uniref:fasciculation and elongation protein zeta-2-like isoform X1 n=2 Tax=Planococcus citri TaxID=170843 RepID=UPI0031F900BA